MGKIETQGDADGSAGNGGAVSPSMGAAAGARAELRRELETYWRRRRRLLPAWTRDTSGLRAAVHDYVVALRLAGSPPERVLVAVKEAVLEVTETQGPEAHTIIDMVVRWSIESYFPAARP